jgi:hypothetical protein
MPAESNRFFDIVVDPLPILVVPGNGRLHV